MKPEEFISFANRMAAMLGGKADGAIIRSVVSRSYYGAFHMALDVLKELGCAPRDDNHGQVRRIFQYSGNDDAVAAANTLRDMHGDRIEADYKLTNVKIETCRFAQLAIESASEFSSRLNALQQTCSDSALRQQVVSAMRQYCQTTQITLR